MKPARTRLTRIVPAALAAACLALPATAQADEPATPTPMAQAIHAGFLLDAPAPPAPVAVCVIDSGVTLNPDTQGAVIDRKTAFDDAQGVGDDVGDVPGYLPHGTMVASVIAAPKNGWGTVGIWPQAKIVSVGRSTRQTCMRRARCRTPRRSTSCMSHPEVKVISLSIAGVTGIA